MQLDGSNTFTGNTAIAEGGGLSLNNSLNNAKGYAAAPAATQGSPSQRQPQVRIKSNLAPTVTPEPRPSPAARSPSTVLPLADSGTQQMQQDAGRLTDAPTKQDAKNAEDQSKLATTHGLDAGTTYHIFLTARQIEQLTAAFEVRTLSRGDLAFSITSQSPRQGKIWSMI